MSCAKQTLTKGLTDKGRLALIAMLSGILLWSPIIQHYFHTTGIYANPFFRAFEFIIGMLICQLNMKQNLELKMLEIIRTPYACILTCCLLVAGVSIAYRLGIPGDYMLYSWIALPCFMSLLVSLGYLRFERLQGSKSIQYLSALSFSIFLSQLEAVWHSVRIAMEYIGCSSNIANIILSAFICFCLANCFHYFIEKPSTKYLKAKLLN